MKIHRVRFTDNDGTVTDNLTGLMWTINANYIRAQPPSFDNDRIAGDGAVTWQHALDFVAGMNAGTYGNFGYTDWRLPDVKELLSLIDYMQCGPALPSGHLFIEVQFDYYWSSTSYANYPDFAWIVSMWYGYMYNVRKSYNSCYVWLVRSVKEKSNGI